MKDPKKLNQFKNPNNKVEKIKKKKIVFNTENLYIQHVYQMSIINIIGMIIYKPPESFTDNIAFNETFDKEKEYFFKIRTKECSMLYNYKNVNGNNFKNKDFNNKLY